MRERGTLNIQHGLPLTPFFIERLSALRGGRSSVQTALCASTSCRFPLMRHMGKSDSEKQVINGLIAGEDALEQGTLSVTAGATAGCLLAA